MSDQDHYVEFVGGPLDGQTRHVLGTETVEARRALFERLGIQSGLGPVLTSRIAYRMREVPDRPGEFICNEHGYVLSDYVPEESDD